MDEDSSIEQNNFLFQHHLIDTCLIVALPVMSCELRLAWRGHTKKLSTPHRSSHAKHALLQHTTY